MKILKNILGKVDGKKSIVGFLALAACIIAECFGVNVPDVAYGLSGTLLSVGALHKAAKVHKMLEVALKALELLLTVSPKIEKKEIEKNGK